MTQRNNTLLVWALLLFFAVCMPSTALADDPKDILIVVNKAVPVRKLDEEDVKKIFLKERIVWVGGQGIVPINVKDKALRDDFRKRVMNMTEVQEDRYWKDQQIRFGDAKPPVFSKALKAVFKLKGGITYVYRSEYLKGVVNVVLVIPVK